MKVESDVKDDLLAIPPLIVVRTSHARTPCALTTGIENNNVAVIIALLLIAVLLLAGIEVQGVQPLWTSRLLTFLMTFYGHQAVATSSTRNRQSGSCLSMKKFGLTTKAFFATAARPK
nr:hypothetical protein Iba_chr13aCG13430 [Ipomoea batatas]